MGSELERGQGPRAAMDPNPRLELPGAGTLGKHRGQELARQLQEVKGDVLKVFFNLKYFWFYDSVSQVAIPSPRDAGEVQTHPHTGFFFVCLFFPFGFRTEEHGGRFSWGEVQSPQPLPSPPTQSLIPSDRVVRRLESQKLKSEWGRG